MLSRFFTFKYYVIIICPICVEGQSRRIV